MNPKRPREPSQAQLLEKLKTLAASYKKADQQLGRVCGDRLDPIACTVFAYKGQSKHLPKEASVAGGFLKQLVTLHGKLVNEYGMDNDVVRQVWLSVIHNQDPESIMGREGHNDIVMPRLLVNELLDVET